MSFVDSCCSYSHNNSSKFVKNKLHSLSVPWTSQRSLPSAILLMDRYLVPKSLTETKGQHGPTLFCKLLADHFKLKLWEKSATAYAKDMWQGWVRSGHRHQRRWEGSKVCPKRQSRQTVRFHATQLDFIPEGPQRIVPDATELDPGRFEEFNVLPCHAHYICSENSNLFSPHIYFS